MKTDKYEQQHIKVSSLNVENLVTKLSEADFVNYIRSFDIFCAIETFTSAVFDFSTHFQDNCVFIPLLLNFLCAVEDQEVWLF